MSTVNDHTSDNRHNRSERRNEGRQVHTQAISPHLSLYKDHPLKAVTTLSMGLLHSVNPLWKGPHRYTEGCAS